MENNENNLENNELKENNFKTTVEQQNYPKTEAENALSPAFTKYTPAGVDTHISVHSTENRTSEASAFTKFTPKNYGYRRNTRTHLTAPLSNEAIQKMRAEEMRRVGGIVNGKKMTGALNLGGGAVNFSSLGNPNIDPLPEIARASGLRVRNFTDGSVTGVYSSSGYNRKNIVNPARRTGKRALREREREMEGSDNESADKTSTDQTSVENVTPVEKTASTKNSTKPASVNNAEFTVQNIQPEQVTETYSLSQVADAESINNRRKQLEKRLNPTALDGVRYSDDMAKENLRAVRSASRRPRKTSGEEMKIIYLGGVGEIGKNMTAIEYNGEIIVIDCGVMFPSEDLPGIDYVVPDVTYLKDNADRVVAFLITHGHEDHIGAIPYVIKNFPKASIYSSRLTLALIENKLREHNIKNVNLQIAKAREPYKVGNFAVEFIDVNHSIADAYAIKISTPAGTILHSGDFKIDFRPIDGKMIDLPRIAEIGEEGVDLFMCESTNVERPGYTVSESDVGAKIEEIFKDSVGRRVYVATFSSNIYRVQQIINLAVKYGRRVATVGRSISNNLEAATKVGKLNFKKSVFVDVDKINNLPDGEVVVICTGAQGETASALSRLANGEYTGIEIGSNDTIIFSSSPIPGNESMINRIINNLCKKGAIVIHENVHASGHACQEELKTIHSLVKPKNFVPVHGEYRHLKRHAELAESLGVPAENIMVVEIGNTIILKDGKITRGENVKAGEVLIDGLGKGDVASVVLRDRRQLGEDGIVVVSTVISKQMRQIIGCPVILTRGLIYQDEVERLNSEVQRAVIEAIQSILNLPKFDIDEAKNMVRRPIRAYFNKKMGRTPIILPIFHFV